MSSEELYIPGIIDTRPNPLEVLGLSADAAARLSVEGLERAAKSMYRAWVTDLHPDAHQGRMTAADTRQWERVSAAQARLEDPETDLLALRDDYVTETRKKRKPAEPRDNDSIGNYSRYTAPLSSMGKDSSQTLARTAHLMNSLLDSVVSPEVVSRYKRLDILVSDIPRDIDGASLNRSWSHIRSIGNRVVQQSLVTSFNEQLPGELDTAFSRSNPDPNKQTIVFVEQQRARQFDAGTPVRTLDKTKDASQVVDLLPAGWHLVRGIQTSSQDNRNLLSYQPVGATRTLDRTTIIGSLNPTVWVRLQKAKLDVPVRRRLAAIDGGEEFLGDNTELSFIETYLSFTSGDIILYGEPKANVDLFRPKIVPGWMLIGHKQYGQKGMQKALFPLGTVKYAVAEKA